MAGRRWRVGVPCAAICPHQRAASDAGDDAVEPGAEPGYSRAKKAARHVPVFITDHGRPTRVLPASEDFCLSPVEPQIGGWRREQPDPARGARLRAWLDGQVPPVFGERILPFDATVARRCAAVRTPDPCSERDAMIAATALVHGLHVVTRNTAGLQ